MRKIFNLPRFIAIPLAVIFLAVSSVLLSFLFAILLIPMAIAGYRFWRTTNLSKATNDADVIEAEFTVLDKNTDK